MECFNGKDVYSSLLSTSAKKHFLINVLDSRVRDDTLAHHVVALVTLFLVHDARNVHPIQRLSAKHFKESLSISTLLSSPNFSSLGYQTK